MAHDGFAIVPVNKNKAGSPKHGRTNKPGSKFNICTSARASHGIVPAEHDHQAGARARSDTEACASAKARASAQTR